MKDIVVSEQIIDCSILNTVGYNVENEAAYLRKTEVRNQFGCGIEDNKGGREIFFKNSHPSKAINGFIVKSWKYNNGHTIYDVCQKFDFSLKPNESTISLGCNYISQTQPCSFKIFGKFIKQ